ncbi:hypothetical protein scyTo_0002967 [Scyliorhinus torazame]|uniref:Uncharacterized protein n=1 Tax=Scyliorhinus torazame TaxID=75743 RepID=A0A401PLA1_SCYTO|nr:hypothetical protein [Scyliorhinus torazame]
MRSPAQIQGIQWRAAHPRATLGPRPQVHLQVISWPKKSGENYLQHRIGQQPLKKREVLPLHLPENRLKDSVPEVIPAAPEVEAGAPAVTAVLLVPALLGTSQLQNIQEADRILQGKGPLHALGATHRSRGGEAQEAGAHGHDAVQVIQDTARRGTMTGIETETGFPKPSGTSTDHQCSKKAHPVLQAQPFIFQQCQQLLLPVQQQEPEQKSEPELEQKQELEPEPELLQQEPESQPQQESQPDPQFTRTEQQPQQQQELRFCRQL